MRYQEMLRGHGYFYQRRPADIPRDLTGLGLLEYHASIPNRQIFISNFNELPDRQVISTDDQLARSGIGETIRPEAFPQTGFLGPGTGGG